MLRSDQENLQDAVTWAYRMLLGREPENADVVNGHAGRMNPATVEEVRRHFRSSREYQSKVENNADPVMRLIAGVPDPLREAQVPDREAGFYKDLFGVKTRLSYLPGMYQRYSGGIPGDFGLEHLPMHDATELRGMIEALQAAQGSFAIMELGAGWGPWMSMAAVITRRLGLPCKLIAVEGLAEHIGFIDTHLRDNGVDPSSHRILHGVVAAADGTARFQKLSGSEYGATIMDDPAGEQFEVVPSYSLASLLANEPIIDIIHCDIQGHEVEALSAGISALNQRVKRLVVGTHGRTIEQDLLGLFGRNRWRLVDELACAASIVDGKPAFLQDGAQYWLNEALA